MCFNWNFEIGGLNNNKRILGLFHMFPQICLPGLQAACSMESPVVFTSPGVRTISGMASMAMHSGKPAQPDSRGFCFLPPLLGSAVTSPVMSGEALGPKTRLQGSYHPHWGSTLTKVRWKVKRNPHINSSSFLLDGPLCAYGS